MGWASMLATLGININPYVQGLHRARTEAKTFGADAGKTLKNSLAGAFGVAAVAGLARKTMEFGGQLTDLKDRLGATTDGLQEWFYAAQQTGAGQEDVTKFFETLRDKRDEALQGNESALASFKKLGVSIEDLQNLSADDLGKKIAGSVKEGDIDKLGSALKDVGGKSAAKLVPAFKTGLKDLADEAHKLGLIMDEETIGKMDSLGDKVDQLMTRFMGPMASFLGFILTIVEKIETTFQLLGAFSTKLDWKDMLNPFSIGKKFWDFAGSKEAQDIINKPKAAAQASVPKEKREFVNKEEENRAEKIADLKLKLLEKAEKAAQKEMTKEQQILFLTQKRAEMLRTMHDRTKSEEDRLKAATQYVDVNSELAGLRKKDKLGALSADSLASVGGFIGRAGQTQNPVVDLARQQLTVQKQIASHTDPDRRAKNYF